MTNRAQKGGLGCWVRCSWVQLQWRAAVSQKYQRGEAERAQAWTATEVENRRGWMGWLGKCKDRAFEVDPRVGRRSDEGRAERGVVVWEEGEGVGWQAGCRRLRGRCLSIDLF